MKYIFPNFLANVMSKVDLRTQYEASMLSMTLMSVGLILSAVYAVIYLNLQTWFKWVLGFNTFFGIVFMSSYIVTTYQQYLNYMQVIKLQEELVKGGNLTNEK